MGNRNKEKGDIIFKKHRGRERTNKGEGKGKEQTENKRKENRKQREKEEKREIQKTKEKREEEENLFCPPLGNSHSAAVREATTPQRHRSTASDCFLHAR